MNTIWNYVKGLFNTLEESSPSKPYLHETIERTAAEQAAYEKWKLQLGNCEILNWLHTEQVQHSINPAETNDDIEFISTSSLKGFVMKFGKQKFPRTEIIHLFDLLKDRVRELGYTLYMSDLRTYQRNQTIETIQRHYLKPRLRIKDFPAQKLSQQFGNITIQLVERNEKITHLKFNATKYRDHLYQEADAFEDLITALLV